MDRVTSSAHDDADRINAVDEPPRLKLGEHSADDADLEAADRLTRELSLVFVGYPSRAVVAAIHRWARILAVDPRPTAIRIVITLF